MTETPTPSSDPSPSPLTDEEVHRRIKGLIELGSNVHLAFVLCP